MEFWSIELTCNTRRILRAALLFCLIIYCFDNSAKADVIWGSKSFPPMQGEKLEKAQRGLLLYHSVPDTAAFENARINYATISEDKIIVMMTEIKETKWSTVYTDYIAMFDLTGDYDAGYELVIDGHNGVSGVTYEHGQLLYYLSSYQCVYQLEKSQCAFYYAPSTDVRYLHYYQHRPATSQKIEYDDNHLGIYDSDGHLIPILQTSYDREKTESSNRTVSAILSMIYIAGGLCIMAVYIKRRLHP